MAKKTEHKSYTLELSQVEYEWFVGSLYDLYLRTDDEGVTELLRALGEIN